MTQSVEKSGLAPITYSGAVDAIATGGWANLDFFRSGAGRETAARLDARVAAGVQVLPPPADVFKALELTQPDQVRAVILGQDPYPTPGDAHGLAFSVADPEQRIPASLRTIFTSLETDLGISPPAHGNLTRWARSGILLLNVTLSVEAGKANSHKTFGWSALAGDIMEHLNERPAPTVFMLWGKFAQQAGAGIDASRHCVIETAHPSPLARGPGPQHRFVTSQPFTQAQQWLLLRGLPPIDWRL
ncbi:uracil-DNA glycosylase [Anderseniella sp. Alg231-50]|uniref:uracil-DNA glycosylase n=1 Tax=Anderseniella sp. Alg231-50 TaxID=1922226 RepID=UPI00307BF2AD